MRADGAQRGQALVEFALAIPLLLVIVFGIFDLGRAVYASSTLNNAAREAARLAIVDQTLADVQARGASAAVSLAVDTSAIDVDFRSASASETPGSCTLPSGGSAVGTDAIVACLAVVTISYEYTAATPIVGSVVGPITLTGEARFPVEFNCVDAPGMDCPLGQ
jgi:Flp pilus assembly protein TadG